MTEKFKTLFRFAKKSKLKASDGNVEGKYPFLTSSQKVTKRTDNPKFFEECLVFGNGGSANVHYLNEPFSTTSHCYIAERKEKNINTKYAYYYLSGNLHILEQGFKGAGLKNISSKYIAELDIPILPLETQNKIVTLLDKANSLVQKREKGIDLLDELLRAQFLEMFGSLASNTQKYPLRKLKEFEVFITSGGRGWKKYYSDVGGRFIRSYDVQMNHISDEDIILVNPPDNQEAKRTRVESNDILLTITGSKIGRVTIVPPDFGHGYVSQHVAIIRVKDINPLYLSYFLSHHSNGQYLVLRKQYGQTKPGLNFKQIRDFDVTLPPSELQNQFESICHFILAHKETLTQSKTELENLYNSLLQRAFNEQLNFNVDAELDVLLAAIDVDKEENDIRDIATVYASRLLERLDSQDFENQTQYKQAKQVAFQMLKEGAIEQEYDTKESAVKMKLV